MLNNNQIKELALKLKNNCKDIDNKIYELERTIYRMKTEQTKLSDVANSIYHCYEYNKDTAIETFFQPLKWTLEKRYNQYNNTTCFIYCLQFGIGSTTNHYRYVYINDVPKNKRLKYEVKTVFLIDNYLYGEYITENKRIDIENISKKFATLEQAEQFAQEKILQFNNFLRNNTKIYNEYKTILGNIDSELDSIPALKDAKLRQ